jgi:hypothetical protein
LHSFPRFFFTSKPGFSCYCKSVASTSDAWITVISVLLIEISLNICDPQWYSVHARFHKNHYSILEANKEYRYTYS